MDAATVFPSKVDWWLVLILLSIPGIPIALQWAELASWSPPSSFWTPIIVVTLLVIAFCPIRYVIEGETVSVQCGLISWEYTSFQVQEVQSVRPTHNLAASPALSLDRLSIDLGFRAGILISPKDKAGFLGALAELDPQLILRDGSLVRSA
jgi:hypothetical protein